MIMEQMEEKERIIAEVMDNFDFDRVEKVMQFLGWSWFDDGGRFEVPSISVLKWRAEGMLDDVMEHYGTGEYCSVKCGGFVATLTVKGELSLEFVLNESEAV